MSITKKDVLHVADLARLALSEKEIEIYTDQLQRILSYVEKLSELDTSKVEASAGPERGTPVREDVACNWLGRDEALKNAPQEERGCFKVPQIIE